MVSPLPTSLLVLARPSRALVGARTSHLDLPRALATTTTSPASSSLPRTRYTCPACTQRLITPRRLRSRSRPIPQPAPPQRRALHSTPPRRSAPDDDDNTRPSTHAPTYYDLFPSTLHLGPPPAGPFAIDARTLRREFLALQARTHPDLFPPGGDKARAEAASARLNDAYRTLLSPLARAQYLLRLAGVDVAADEGIRGGGTPGVGSHDDVDEALLLEVLAIRERIEELATEAEADTLHADNEARLRFCESRLDEAFARADLAAARRQVARLRYWVNVAEALRDWEPGKTVVLAH